MKIVWVMGAPVVCLLGMAAHAAAEWSVTPVAGPPGTEVTVSGIDSCAPTDGRGTLLAWGTSDGQTVSVLPVPFTPPSGTIVVPDVPFGVYRIYPSCGAGEGFVEFTVAPAVIGNPNLTG